MKRTHPDMIKMEDLKPGYLYKIRARNARFGIWDPAQNGFVISRTKFHSNYLFTEFHWDEDPTFGTAVPYEEIEKSPFVSEDFRMVESEHEEYGKCLLIKKSKEILDYLNSYSEKGNEE
jgi:hypothetical protein